jgi:hypothetical protein
MITGTPTKAGAYGPYIFAVTDKNGLTASTSGLNLTIAAAGPTVTTTALADGSVGVAYSMTLAATGGTGPYTWSVTTGGALPAGLTLAGNGTISGTPATAGLYGPYAFTVTDANNATGLSTNLVLRINSVTAQCVRQGNESALNALTPYGFLLKGSDGKGNPIDIVGSLKPNGAGGISAASVDYNGFSNGLGLTQMSVDLANSNYSFATASAQGCLYLSLTAQSSGGAANVKFQFTLGQLSASIYHSGRIIESDSVTAAGTRAAGFIYVQDASSFLLSSLQPNYSFGVDGLLTPDGTHLVRTAIAGTFTNASGVLSNGFADYDQGGAVSGALTGGSGVINDPIDAKTGRGTGTYTTPTPTGSLAFNFVLYMLNASDFILMSTDPPSSVPLLAGRALASSASYAANPLNGSLLFVAEGYDAAVPGNFVQLGNLTASNSGSITPATVYFNDAGTTGKSQYQNLSYTVNGTSGRGVIVGFGAAPPIAYLTGANGDDNIAAFIVGTDAQASSGLLVNQTTATPAYTLASLNGTFAGSSDEDVDGKNGSYLATFVFNGAGGYTVSSPLLDGSVGFVPSPLGTFTINPDGSGTLDGTNFTFVTNGTTIYAIPKAGDPLLFVFVQ